MRRDLSADNMSMATDPSKVVCFGEGLHFGYFKNPIHATVDTRKAGPGQYFSMVLDTLLQWTLSMGTFLAGSRHMAGPFLGVREHHFCGTFG